MENLHIFGYAIAVYLLIIGIYMHHKHKEHPLPLTDHELRSFIMSTASSLANITKLLTAGTGGGDVAGVAAANAKLDLITADLGIGAAAGAPAVTALSPATGPAAGGTSVSISGTGFKDATGVSFGSVPVPAGNFTVQNDTLITATSPAVAAGISDVIVTGPNGTSAAVVADQFTAV